MSSEPGRGRSIIVIWGVFLLGFYLVAGYLSGSKVYEDRTASAERHLERLDPQAMEKGRTQAELDLLSAADAADVEEVTAGLYVDRIVELSTKATGWTVDFYIWFNWRDTRFAPGETFQVIDGEILSRTLVEETHADDKHYALYRVSARITKFFNVVRYPLDNHLLTIRIEDSEHAWQILRYQPDTTETQYSSRIAVPGYALGRADLISKPHAYKGTRGDPRLPAAHQAVYSQLVYGIAIERPDWGLYFKMFQGLFASVAIALLAFVFGPLSGERISLGVGAFFASVASSYVNLNELPGVGLVTLTDMVNGLGMVTIFLTLMASVISAKVAQDPKTSALAPRFDRLSLALFTVGFVGVNLVMALVAAV